MYRLDQDANQSNAYAIRSKRPDKKFHGEDPSLPQKKCDDRVQEDWAQPDSLYQTGERHEDPGTNDGDSKPENAKHPVTLTNQYLTTRESWILASNGSDEQPKVSVPDDSKQHRGTVLLTDDVHHESRHEPDSTMQGFVDSSEVRINRSAPEGRKVSFGWVQVRVHELILSDHPDSQGGLSIGIGWQHEPDCTYSLKYWESRKQRYRQEEQLIYSKAKRIQVLREWGYLQKDIDAAVRATHKIRRQRQKTMQNFAFEESVDRFVQLLKPRFYKRRNKIMTRHHKDEPSSPFPLRSSLRRSDDVDSVEELNVSSVECGETVSLFRNARPCWRHNKLFQSSCDRT
jgi:hypothetical protein